MLRTALLLSLACLALAAKLPKKDGGGKPEVGVGPPADAALPQEIESDEDVKRIFRFLVQNGNAFANKVREEVAESDAIRTAVDPAEEFKNVLEAVANSFKFGMKDYGLVLHSLGMLSGAIFEHQLSFKLAPGGCNALYTLSENYDIEDPKQGAREAAMALSDDLHCMANEAATEEGIAELIEQYKTKDITASFAMGLAAEIAQGIIKSNDDVFKIMHGAIKVMGHLSPELQKEILGAVGDKPSKEEKVERLLRTLLKELDVKQ